MPLLLNEEMSFKSIREDSNWQCWVVNWCRKTVPDTSSVDRKVSVVECRSGWLLAWCELFPVPFRPIKQLFWDSSAFSQIYVCGHCCRPIMWFALIQLAVVLLFCFFFFFFIYGCTLSAIWPSLMPLPILGKVCPSMSRLHRDPLCLFSEVASSLSFSGVPSHDIYHNFCSACAVTVLSFLDTNRSFHLLTYFLLFRFPPSYSSFVLSLFFLSIFFQSLLFSLLVCSLLFHHSWIYYLSSCCCILASIYCILQSVIHSNP